MFEEFARRRFLGIAAAGLAAGALPRAISSETAGSLTVEDLAHAESITGVQTDDAARRTSLPKVEEFLAARGEALPFVRDPELSPIVGGGPIERERPSSLRFAAPGHEGSGEDPDFRSIDELGALLRKGEVSSVELARRALTRLERLDPALRFVVTLLEARAMEEARRADAAFAAGRDLGPLHGIPYGAKDILAAKGGPTSWGAATFRERILDYDAAVIERLAAKGAVLVVKLSTGALAMGDKWYGGMTRNPWNPERGSSGSSAGPASAVAAGAVPFAIGSETLGSIVSPCTRCGATGLRPTFGRVPRYGAMALSWSMDKLGPITRSARDAALVFAALEGADRRDLHSVSRPFAARGRIDIGSVRFGRLEGFEKEVATKDAILALERAGAKFTTVTLPRTPMAFARSILEVEASAAFDEFLRSGGAATLGEQGPNDWPAVFRAGRYIPAVDYIQALRLRTRLMQETAQAMTDVDVIVSGPYSGGILLTTNLCGQPTVCVPAAFRDERTPSSVTFTGWPHEDDVVLAAAEAFQGLTTHHLLRPALTLR